GPLLEAVHRYRDSLCVERLAVGEGHALADRECEGGLGLVIGIIGREIRGELALGRGQQEGGVRGRGVRQEVAPLRHRGIEGSRCGDQPERQLVTGARSAASVARTTGQADHPERSGRAGQLHEVSANHRWFLFTRWFRAVASPAVGGTVRAYDAAAHPAWRRGASGWGPSALLALPAAELLEPEEEVLQHEAHVQLG